MSFWDRLGTLAQDTAGAIAAQPKFLWDVATAPWNDDEDFNGFANTFQTAGTKWAEAMLKPVTDVAETPGIKQTLQKIDAFNREYIREPLTTGLLAATETGGDIGKAYEMAQDTSFGQAIVGGLGAVLPGRQAVDKIDFEDEAAVDKFFSAGAPRFWSGIGDTSIQVFGDVTIAGGKAAQVARGSSLVTNKINNAQKAAKAINDIAEAADGAVVNKYSKVLDDFAANGAEYAYNHPMIRKSPMRDTIAYGLGQATSAYDASLVMRAGLADPRALEELQVVRASLGNALARQQGILDPYQEFLLKKADDPEGIISLPHTDQAVVKDAMAELEDLRKNDTMFASWEQMAKTPGGVIDRTVGARPMQAVDDFLAKGRSAKFVAGSTRAEAWQPTPFHRMYQIVSWVGNERPAGIVNLNEAESSAEVMAFVNRAHRIAGDEMYSFIPKGAEVPTELKGVTDEKAAGMMAQYYRATTPEERARSLSIIENAGFSAIAGKHGISREKANEIYTTYYRARLSAQESLRKNGFMIDEDGGMISAPVFESQTANYLPMMDLDLLDSLLKRHRIENKNKPLAVLYGLGNEVTGAMDVLQTMFKAGVLMRLGYTIRNGTEAQLRIAASVGSMASMRHLGPGLRNMAFNAGDTLSARTVDRLSISAGPATYQSTKRSLDKVDAELSELQTRYQGIADEYNKQLEESAGKYMPPEDPVFKSANFSDEEVDLLDQGLVPERFGFNSPEYQKAAKAEAKRLSDEHRAIIDEDYLAKQEEVSSAFGLNDRDIKLLETKGLLPLNKVLDAYNSGRLNADELSAIISTGRIEAAGVDGLGEQAYEFFDEATLRGMAVRNGKSRQQYVEVPWRRQTREEYISDGIAQFDAGYEIYTADRLLSEYIDEANAWYGENASQVYSPTTPNIQLESDKRIVEKLIADKKAIREDYAKQLTAIEKAVTRGEKRKVGKGKYKVKSFDGGYYEDFDDALGGQFADIHRSNASAENSFNTLVDDNAGLVSRSLVKTGYGEVKPDAPNYYQAWAHALNYQFRNSAVAMKLMDNTAPADVVKWLKSDPEGRLVANRLGLEPWQIDGHVAAVTDFVGRYIPDANLRQLLVNSTENAPISPEMLRGTYTGTDGLPTIHGQILEENLNLVSVKHTKEIVNGVFRLIGSMPEDALARHPLYISLYRTELKRRVDMFEGTNARRLTTQEQADLMAITHKVALRQLKNTLFTIDRKTNLAHYMRLISPFFSAFENTAKTWAKIAYEKPQTINRANLIFTSPNRAGIATDENGNPVPPEEASMNDYIWLQVPESLKSAPFIGKGLTSLTEMGIQKKSLDVVFQGDALHVPVGPYVAIPISEMVKKKPELEKTLAWAIPYGPERDAVRAFLPSWVKRQLTKQDGQSNQQYANTYAQIWTTEQHKRREAGQPAATAAEVEKMTDAYYNMRSVANLILPFAPTFQTPYKFYIDQWRQYQEQFGMEAQTKYWQDYGDDFFEFTQSLSKNTTGSFASIGSVGNAKAHADLITELSVIDPKLIGIVTNAGQAYDFSQAAYMWQQANTISPSSSEFYRTRKDPAEAALDNERSLGWIKYRDVMANIDSEMQRRGLTNLQSKKAADLASMKKQLVAQLGATNTAWYDDYLDTDGSKTNKVIRGLETIVNNEKFMSQYGDNPTFKSIAVYLEVRQATEQALASRPSKSIDAKANADIKYAFEAVANQLKQQDIGFGDLYDRWLSYDSVYDAVRSQGVAQ